MAGEPLLEDFPLTQAWIDNSPNMYAFTSELGIEWTPYISTGYQAFYPQPQWDTKNLHSWAPVNGSPASFLEPKAEELGAQIMLQTPATSLIVDKSGHVIGRLRPRSQ